MKNRILLLSLLAIPACAVTYTPSTSSQVPGSLSRGVESSVPSTAPPLRFAPVSPELTAVIAGSLPSTPLSLPDDAAMRLNIPSIPTPPAPAETVARAVDQKAIQNLSAIEKEYGIALTDTQRRALMANNVLALPLGATTIAPNVSFNDSEYVGLYSSIRGGTLLERTPANSVLYTSDLFITTYNRLNEELLKEAENTVFFPAMSSLSERLLTAAAKKRTEASTEAERARWSKVHGYVAIGSCLLKQGAPLPATDSPEARDAALKVDEKRDAQENVEGCIRALKLGDVETVTLETVGLIYAAEGPAAPPLFLQEFKEYSRVHERDFVVDFSQFKPRSHYTGSSLRRQYFRAMSWYIQTPFYVEDPRLSSYAFGLSQLLAEDAEGLRDYQKMDRAIRFLVGGSDDLGPLSYLRALEDGRGEKDPATTTMAALRAAPDPQVRSPGATATTLALTKGMRFFSPKALHDTIWTSKLTQGDEPLLEGEKQKLPPMASSLEVMALLGSSAAEGKIQTLPFINDDNRDVVSTTMARLHTETDALTDADWQVSAYSTALWSLRGMFEYEDAQRRALPAFMQTPVWQVKTLQTASGSWTELRHTTLLYAKQSFAELGAGLEDECDRVTVPPPAMGYVEPQPVLYARLAALGRATKSGLDDMGFSSLRNAKALEKYVSVLEAASSYSARELADAEMKETLKASSIDDPENAGKKCTSTKIVKSDWEELRTFIDVIAAAQAVVAPGEIVMAKDVRAAKVADVHTGFDSTTPPWAGNAMVLYQATGVPQVLLALVHDRNGARAVIGFAYSHYETYEPLGPRKTDEEWQQEFYEGDPHGTDAFTYLPVDSWPTQPAWYAPLSGGK